MKLQNITGSMNHVEPATQCTECGNASPTTLCKIQKDDSNKEGA